MALACNSWPRRIRISHTAVSRFCTVGQIHCSFKEGCLVTEGSINVLYGVSFEALFCCWSHLPRWEGSSWGRKPESLKFGRQCLCFHSVRALHWWKHCAILVYNTPASRKIEREDSFCEWVAKKRALLDIWNKLIAVLPRLNSLNDDELWMPRCAGQILLTWNHRAVQSGHNNFVTVIPDRCPEFLMIATCRRICVSSRVSVLSALGLLHRSREVRIDKVSSNNVYHNSEIIRICRAWPSLACGARTGKELLFALLCMLHYVSWISFGLYFLHIARLFLLGPVQHTHSMKAMVMLYLQEVTFFKTIDIVQLSNASLTTHMYV